MKKITSLFAIALLMVAITISCKTPVVPLSERVAKVWTPRIVKENSTIVYSNGGSNNTKPGYSSYRLSLSGTTATISEIDGNSYSGTFSIQGEMPGAKIVVTGVSPEPTGTNGVLEYTIDSINEDNTEMVITLNGLYPKTGNTTNQYTLVSQ